MEYGRVRIYSLQQRQTAMSTVKLIFLPHYSRHSGYTAKRVRNTNPDKSVRRQKKGEKVRMEEILNRYKKWLPSDPHLGCFLQ